MVQLPDPCPWVSCTPAATAVGSWACGEALGHIRADDLPPYATILLVGHLIVPLVLWVDARLLILAGLSLTAWSLHLMTGFSMEMGQRPIVVSGVILALVALPALYRLFESAAERREVSPLAAE